MVILYMGCLNYTGYRVWTGICGVCRAPTPAWILSHSHPEGPPVAGTAHLDVDVPHPHMIPHTDPPL